MFLEFSWRPSVLRLSLLLGLGISFGVSAIAAYAQQGDVTARYTGTKEPQAAKSPQIQPSPEVTQATSASNVILFNAAQVGVSASSAQTLTATFAVSGYSGSFTPTATLHHGLNYTLGAVTCTASGASESCSVPIQFIPVYPGGRKDALFLMNGTTRLATVLLGGVGNAPFAFTQTASSIATSIPFPSDYLYKSITDEDGTVYVLNHSFIGKITKAGAASQLTFTGTPYIYDFALDGAGVLYIATGFGNQMVTYDTVQGTQGTYTLPTSDYWYPTFSGLSGSLFVLNQDTQKLFELKPDGTNAQTPITPSVNQDYQMTMDGDGDKFIGGYTINEITASAVQSQVNSVGATDGLDVDAAKTVYATRYAPTNGVAMLGAADYSTPLNALDTTSSPLGVSVGPDGTVNISNYNNLDVVDRSHSATSIDFGEVTAGTTSSSQAGAIYNGGNQPLSITDYTFDGTAFSLESNQSTDCAPSIQVAPGAVCEIVATFTPPHPGVYNNTITIKSNSLNASNSLTTIKVSGSSYGIYDVPSPATLNFGSQVINTSATKTVSLTNNGYYYSSTIYRVNSDTAAVTVDQGTCATALAVGASCNLNLTFTPTAVQGYSATITVVTYVPGTSVPNQTFTFSVAGTGKLQTTVATPVVTPSTGTYHSNQTVTITDATAGATIYYTTDGSTPTSGSKVYSAPFQISQTGTTVKAFATANGDTDSAVDSATYTLQAATPVLSPPGGSYSGTQSVSIATTTTGAQIFYSTDGSDPSKGTLYKAPISVSATGTTIQAVAILGGYLNSSIASATYTIQVPGISASPSALNFANQTVATTGPALTSTLKNTGQAQLQISSIAITGANPGDFAQTNNCGASLAAGASCTISVTFTPADAVSYAASVTVTSNASNSPAVIALSGAGTAPPVPIATLAPSALSFSATTGTTTAIQTATLQNTGNADMTISGITLTGANSSDFAQTNNCGSSLAAGASCSISITFTPSSAASFTAALSIEDNAAGSPQTVALSGTGSAPPQADFTLSTTSSSETVAMGGSAQFNLTVGTSGGPYNKVITLSASGLPSGAFASFSPASVSPGSGTTTSILTIQTGTYSADSRSQMPLWPFGSPALAMIYFAFSRGKRKQWLQRTLLVLLALISLGAAGTMIGCGGRSHTTSTIVITATSGSDVHTTTVQLIVK